MRHVDVGAVGDDVVNLRAVTWREAMRATGATDDDQDDTRAVALILASLQVGPDLVKVCKFLEIEEVEVRWLAENLERNGIWRGGRVHGDYFSEDGGVALLLDATVAVGLMERAQ